MASHNSALQRNAQRATRNTLTLDTVWIGAALALLALRPLLTPLPPHDLWWHLAMGRDILAQGAIPTVDAYSFTQAGAPFYDQSWLAQVLMVSLDRLGGVELLIAAQALVIALAYGLLLRLCIRRSGRVRLSVALLLLATLPLSFDNWLVRPQSYAIPLFVGFLYVLTAWRLGWNNRLWLLPLVMVLWVNVHGTFVLGLALVAVVFVGEALKRMWRPGARGQGPQSASATPPPLSLRPLAIWGGLAALATLANPRGWGVLGYVRNLVGSSAVTSLVTEWAPPTVREPGGAIFFLFVLGLVAVLVYARRRPDLTDLLLAGAFFWLALGAGRSIIWFGIAATPLLVVQAGTLLPPPRPAAPGAPAINAALFGLLSILLAICLPWVKPYLIPPPQGALLSDDTPVAAVEALRALPDRPGRLFHAMGYGSYLMWAAPEQPVFADPRIELYPYAQWVDYINLGQANNVEARLARYRIDGLLLDKKEQQPLVAWARQAPGWRLRYEDARAVLFTHQR